MKTTSSTVEVGHNFLFSHILLFGHVFLSSHTKLFMFLLKIVQILFVYTRRIMNLPGNQNIARNLLCKQESSQTLYSTVKYAILNVT